MNKVTVPTALPTLQSKLLMLRAMADSDAAALFEIYGDPLIMKYTDESPFPAQDTVGVMLKSVRTLLAEGRSLEWVIVSQDNEEVIGTCGLHNFNKALRLAEVGCLLKRSAWGKGFMAEALSLLMRFASDVLRLNRLTADVAPENERAQRLFKKLGFRQERLGIFGINLNASQ